MIDVKSLSFGYTSRRRVLNNVSLNLGEGHIHGLLGCNGIGKTTLLKIISGIMRPDSGVVRVDGVDPMSRQPQLFSELMIIPEEFNLPAMSLERYAEVTSPFYPRFDMGSMRSYCEEFNVNPKEHLHSISMGQRKKAYIAFALACNVKMLLMDEPTNGLDIPSKSVFRRLLAGYVDESRMVVISTHQIADIESLLDSIVILDQQGVVLNATTAQISERLKFDKVEALDRVIYSERTISGDMAVALNENGEESQLNIELLFNAATVNRDAISAIFKS